MVGPDAYEAIMLGDLKLENGNILVGSHVGFAHWGLPVGCDEPIVVLPSYYSKATPLGLAKPACSTPRNAALSRSTSSEQENRASPPMSPKRNGPPPLSLIACAPKSARLSCLAWTASI